MAATTKLTRDLERISAKTESHRADGIELTQRRDALIIRCFESGLVAREIAELSGLTVARVHQIHWAGREL